MEQTFSITSMIILGALAWQDFRSRMITAWLLPASGILLLISELQHAEGGVIWLNTWVNYILLLIQFVVLTVWISLRGRKWTNIVDSHIGLGDLLFLACIAPVFAPLNFCVLLTGGTLMTLILHLLVRVVKPNSDPKIPLAGYLGVFVLIFSLLSLLRVVPVHLSNGEWLTNYFLG